jgi:hypothetical protein
MPEKYEPFSWTEVFSLYSVFFHLKSYIARYLQVRCSVFASHFKNLLLDSFHFIHNFCSSVFGASILVNVFSPSTLTISAMV